MPIAFRQREGLPGWLDTTRSYCRFKALRELYVSHSDLNDLRHRGH